MPSVAFYSIAVTVVGQFFIPWTWSIPTGCGQKQTVPIWQATEHSHSTGRGVGVLHRWWEDDCFSVTQNVKKSLGETCEFSCHCCLIFELWLYWKGENWNLCVSLTEREYGQQAVTEMEQNVRRNCRNTGLICHGEFTFHGTRMRTEMKSSQWYHFQ